MSEYDVNAKEQDVWTRGQIFRTAIIFIEIVVLLTAVLLNSMNGSDAPAADAAPLPEVVVNLDTDRIPTTIYVSSAYRVFVVQNNVHRLVGTLAECSNRYIETEFDGVLINLHDSIVLHRQDTIHSATFLADTYDVDASHSAVTIRLDTGTTYTVTLHCNGEFGVDSYSSQAEHGSTGLEDLVSEAQQHSNYAYDYFDYRDLNVVAPVSETRQYYDYGAGYGCQGDHH